MTMTNRERLLAILDGRPPDRIPWIPRILNWYGARVAEGNMPERFRGMSELEVRRALRMGHDARDGKIFRVRYEGMDVSVEREGSMARNRYVAP